MKDLILAPHMHRTIDGVHAIILFGGWTKPDRAQAAHPIQDTYLHHDVRWVDYAQGIRLIDSTILLDGSPTPLHDVLVTGEPKGLLTADAIIDPRYPTSQPE